MPNGKKTWIVADGYLPYRGAAPEGVGFEGHEAIMILNCNGQPANVVMDVFFEDEPPVLGVSLSVPAQRIRCFRMDHPDEVGGVNIAPQRQYALRFVSDVDVVVQYGRMDLALPNLAYIGLIGHGE